MKWTVYCHTHVESGRRYIGLTKHTMLQRWNRHVYNSKSSKDGRWHFPNAIRKYGKEAFSHEVLGICNTLEEANVLEVEKIAEFDTTNPENGFNLKPGGSSTSYPVNTPEFRDKLSAGQKRRFSNPLEREKSKAASLKLWNNSEMRVKLSESQKKRFQKPEELAKSSAASKKLFSDPEMRSKMSLIQRERFIDPRKRKELSEAQLNRMGDPEYRERMLAGFRKQNSNPDRSKLSAAQKKRFSNPSEIAKKSAASRKLCGDTNYRMKMSEKINKLWEDPEYRKRFKLALAVARSLRSSRIMAD